MNFATFEYLVFIICVYLLYLVVQHRTQNHLLLVASYIFYGWWDWRFLSLILFSTAVNYLAGLAIHHTEDLKKRRLYLIGALVISFGLLGVFKYLGFFVDSMVDLLQLLGFQPNITSLQIILPVGISFYTFQTASYTIDIYRKELPATKNFLDFALFIAFFPQLVAGPIERAKTLLPQIQQPRQVTHDQITRGCFLILWGLFKKVVIADGAANGVDTVYGMTSVQPTAMDIILATYLFTLQIYCDFSGYSDVARGTAKLLGFELVVNFKLPFFASSPREYWERWHISLATWLRDYVYIPLGGNRHGEWKTQRNVFITVFLSGFWHGAAWNFIFWGIYQALLISFNRLWLVIRKIKPQKLSGPPIINWTKILQIILLFQALNYGRMLFRAESLNQVVDFTRIVFFNFSWHISVKFSLPVVVIVGTILLLAIETYQYVTNDPHYYRRWPIAVRSLFYATLIFLLMAGISNATQEFIYFAF